MRAPTPESPLSAGIQWAARVTSIGLEFTLPTVVGAWIDTRYGTRPAGVLIGGVLGFATGFLHLLQIARGSTGPPRKPDSTTDRPRD